MVFTKPTCIKLRNNEEHYVHISYNELQPNQERNVENMERNSYVPQSKVWL